MTKIDDKDGFPSLISLLWQARTWAARRRTARLLNVAAALRESERIDELQESINQTVAGAVTNERCQRLNELLESIRGSLPERGKELREATTKAVAEAVTNELDRQERLLGDHQHAISMMERVCSYGRSRLAELEGSTAPSQHH